MRTVTGMRVSWAGMCGSEGTVSVGSMSVGTIQSATARSGDQVPDCRSGQSLKRAGKAEASDGAVRTVHGEHGFHIGASGIRTPDFSDGNDRGAWEAEGAQGDGLEVAQVGTGGGRGIP